MAKTAVIIGDSHVDVKGNAPFGNALAARLTAMGYQVTVAGVGGTTARVWAAQNPVCRTGFCVDKSALPRSPDLLVISLGTNDGAGTNIKGWPSASSVVTDLERIIALFTPRQWFWIGPPWLRDNVSNYTNAAMARVYDAAHTADVNIFDSRSSTREPVESGSGDGVHLGPAGARIWADATADAISRTPSGTKVIFMLVALLAAAGVVLLIHQHRRLE